MAHYNAIIFISVALIYSGTCIHHYQIPQSFRQYDSEELQPIIISTYFFKLQWSQSIFPGDDNYTINVKGICEQTYSTCEAASSLCTFDSSENSDGKCFDPLLKLKSCQEVTVTVTKGSTERKTTFNMAPDILNGDITPELSISGNQATVRWTTPASSGDNITCATRARAAFRLGSELVNNSTINVSPGTDSFSEWTLDDCQHGDLTASIIYLSQIGDYVTNMEFHDNKNYPGKGVTTVTAEPSKNCKLDVSWDETCEGAYYKVELDGKVLDQQITEIKTTIEDLGAGSHNVSVQAFWNEGDQMGDKPTPQTVTIPPIAPGAPEEVRIDISVTTTEKLTVTWKEPTTPTCAGEVTGYTIRTDDNDDTAVSVEADKSSYDVTGLDACTDYTITVTAKSDEGTGKPATTTGKTGSTAPGKPVITEESKGTTQIELSWTKPEADSCPLNNYKVTWTPPDGDDSGEKEVESDTPTCDITGLTCNKKYTVTVKAQTEDGKEADSEGSVSTTDDEGPGQTTGVKGSPPDDDTPRKLDVTWTAPKYTCTGSSLGEYTVTWGTGNSKKVEGTSTTIDNLKPCTTIPISVTGSSETGKPGIQGNGEGTTAVAEPEQIRNVTEESGTPYSLMVNWDDPKTPENPCPITIYTVQWTNSDDGAKQEHDVTESSYNIRDLNDCTDYTITVIAHTAKGPGPSSEPKNMTTGANVTDITGVNITPESRSANVTWERPDTKCLLEFIITYSGTTLWTNNQTTVQNGSQTVDDPIFTAELKDLKPYSNYTVCVNIKSGNTTATCNTTITEEYVPSAPRDVVCASNTDTSAILTWQYPEEENGILTQYTIYWGLENEDADSYTVEANEITTTIPNLNKGRYSFTVSANNSKGSSKQTEPIYCDINGSGGGCGGGCIAGIVVGVLLVALAIPAVIYRKKIINKLTQEKSPVEPESPYELKGAAVLKRDFRKHVEDMESDSAIVAYQWLKDESPQKNKFAAMKPFNKGKNRWANIYPFDETRVKLELLSNGPKGSDYINANHITFPGESSVKFIATQGPLERTISDFWRMVWEHGIHDVVMLCNLIEKGKSKCAQYWTEAGEKAMEFGDFTVYTQTEEEDRSNKCITRYIEIVKNGQRRLVKQHHYVAWPDHGIPDNEDDMLKFLTSVKSKFNSHAKNIVVHCSAGVGRSGTFIGLWVLTNLLEERRTAQSIDVHKIALMMREGRCDMIQNKDQYLYLHKCVLRSMENINNQGPALIKVDHEPIYGNVATTNKGFQDTEGSF